MTTEKRRAYVLQHAASIFGRSQALAWISGESRALGGLSPVSLLETDAGYVAVLDLLNTFDHECAPVYM